MKKILLYLIFPVVIFACENKRFDPNRLEDASLFHSATVARHQTKSVTDPRGAGHDHPAWPAVAQ